MVAVTQLPNPNTLSHLELIILFLASLLKFFHTGQMQQTVANVLFLNPVILKISIMSGLCVRPATNCEEKPLVYQVRMHSLTLTVSWLAQSQCVYSLCVSSKTFIFLSDLPQLRQSLLSLQLPSFSFTQHTQPNIYNSKQHPKYIQQYMLNSRSGNQHMIIFTSL